MPKVSTWVNFETYGFWCEKAIGRRLLYHHTPSPTSPHAKPYSRLVILWNLAGELYQTTLYRTGVTARFPQPWCPK